ncbi:hypothetical protein [Sphingobium sp. SCG-1]|uniref:hypothetical protein n=1 Tax=Sphingobium sp. SCG-1 TaxID=2072936 RepID=UPI001CB9BA99|nr:hypothetical protein [Sphingobium sp. SCG-1]
MFRTLIGGLLGGLALFLTGFVFWGTPLANIAYTSADPLASTNLQATLAQTLTPTGTGVYLIPSTTTSEGTILYGKGPIAQVLFNTQGYPSLDTNALIGGLILALVVGVVIALALRLVSSDGATRVRAIVAFAVGAVLWMHIGQPVFNHAPWGYFIYLALSDFIGLVLAGVIASKLMPDVKTVLAEPVATRHDPVTDDSFGSPLRSDSDHLP